MQTVLIHIQKGWPKQWRRCLTTCVLTSTSRGSWVHPVGFCFIAQVIPVRLREEILACIHEGHQRFSKCCEHACLSIWWSGISADLKNKVTQCQQANAMQRGTLGPWRHLGADMWTWRPVVYCCYGFKIYWNSVYAWRHQQIKEYVCMFLESQNCLDNAHQFISVFRTVWLCPRDVCFPLPPI